MDQIGSCHAIIYKVSSTIDGGARITLDVDASSSILVTGLLASMLRGDDLVKVDFTKMEVV